jgi:hypothetical protein
LDVQDDSARSSFDKEVDVSQSRPDSAPDSPVRDQFPQEYARATVQETFADDREISHVEVAPGSDKPSRAESEEETVAYLHFRDELYREFSLKPIDNQLSRFGALVWRAKEILRRVTIDGLQIKLRTKRWDGAAIRRIWSKVRSG